MTKEEFLYQIKVNKNYQNNLDNYLKTGDYPFLIKCEELAEDFYNYLNDNKLLNQYLIENKINHKKLNNSFELCNRMEWSSIMENHLYADEPEAYRRESEEIDLCEHHLNILASGPYEFIIGV